MTDISKDRPVAPPSLAGDERETARRLATARAWLRANRIVGDFIGWEMTGNAAWSMLLELYIHTYSAARPLGVSDVCRASGAPMTTALRWIAALETADMVRRQPDPRDARRSHVLLLEKALWKIHQALDAAAESDRRLGLERLSLSH
ncbi:hypothetical protein [Sphingomonas morindae]|uniref:MarR family transcriptional regulator n=1 Tax=Sphingomonas morindae TaxID=1541170 RepID=A0ABY4XCV9_9SPHN|nr:hypothetical protein [Sphingomonas morindae]USI74752.1 hypothetical protein LHA26_18555 [Sphingomonas morindae]